MRALIDRVVLTPSETAGFAIDLQGDIASMLHLAQLAGATTNGARSRVGSSAVPGVFACSLKVVAGTRFNLGRTTFVWPRRRDQPEAGYPRHELPTPTAVGDASQARLESLSGVS